MRIDVLSVNGVFDTGLAAVLDAFETANELAIAEGLSSVVFDVSVVGLRRKVRTKLGFTVPVLPTKGRKPVDWVIVPALGEKAPLPLVAALARPETQAAARLLRQWTDNGAHVAAACIGTFIAAESGVLDGETVTTTWWLAPLFRQRYPRVRLEDQRMLVRSGRVPTAGAALSHMDMALWLIRSARAVGASKRTLASRIDDVLHRVTPEPEPIRPAWARAFPSSRQVTNAYSVTLRRCTNRGDFSPGRALSTSGEHAACLSGRSRRRRGLL